MMDLKNQSGVNANDGYFEIRYEADGVYIVVYPSIGKGKKVETWEVLDKLTRKQVRNFNKSSIEFAILKADKSPVKIAEKQDEAKIDASVLVTISPDKMKAQINIVPPEGGKLPTAGDIKSILNQSGVVFGINDETIETIVKYPVFNQQISVAEGIPLVNGQNGRVEFYFDYSSSRKPTILEDGRVDYRELNLVEIVQKGKALCGLIPPVPGKAGKTVTGANISMNNGKPAILPKGRNVEVSGDGKLLLASIDGQVCYIDGKVNVFSIYEVPADVDTSTGNINFIGNVIVRGNVLSGFTVEAGGNVEVWGVVEGATIIAGGDVILKRGMQGMGKGHIKSAGDVIAKYIEHSTIEARNEIKAEAIMHSNIKCGNKIELGGKKGLLVGGVTKVGREIIAKVIGSPMATTTEIEVGLDPNIRERYKLLKEELNSVESDIKKAEQAIAILKKLESAGALSPDKQEIMVKSIRTKIYLSNRIEEIKSEIVQIDERMQQEANGKIKAYSNIYPGTKVSIGSCMMFVKENLQYCSLYRDGADIKIGTLER